MTELEEFADGERNFEKMRDALHRAQRQLDEAKRSREVYMATLREAVTDAFSSFKLTPVKPPKLVRASAKMDEVAMPLLSDTQLGKVTSHGDDLQYTSDIGVERVRLFAQKIVELTDIQRADHPVSRCVPVMLGDIVEGEDIFPGQVHLIDSGLYRQVVTASEMVVDFLRYLLGHFESVHAYGVIGNHGRVGRRGVYDPETNMDRMVYWIARMALKDEPRIDWTIPEGRFERNWFSIVEIGNYRALAVHGDQFKGQLGMPWYGFAKKINGWAAGAIHEEFGDVLMGHWHQRALIPLNMRNVYVNGSTESYNTYAQENLGAMSAPSQWLLFVHPEAGMVSSEYGVHLV